MVWNSYAVISPFSRGHHASNVDFAFSCCSSSGMCEKGRSSGRRHRRGDGAGAGTGRCRGNRGRRRGHVARYVYTNGIRLGRSALEAGLRSRQVHGHQYGEPQEYHALHVHCGGRQRGWCQRAHLSSSRAERSSTLGLSTSAATMQAELALRSWHPSLTRL